MKASIGGAARGVAAIVVGLASIVFIVKALHFFTFDPNALGKYFAFKWVIMGHIAGGMAALLMGPFQLSRRFRARFTRAHRVMGRVYIGGTSLGAVCALILASTTARVVNWPYALSLHMLASVWLGTGLMAWRTAVQRRFKVHEEWATRSYIATVAFVAQSLSYEIPFVVRLGPFAETAATIIWFSWTAPMFAYELTRSARWPGSLSHRT